MKGHPSPAEAPIEKDKEIEPSPGNEWTKAQKPKITVIQVTSRKTQADVFEYFKGFETRTDLKDKMQ